MKTGIYIHIPFCLSRCIYCGFYSTTLGAQWHTRYTDAVLREMAMRQDEFGEISDGDSQSGQVRTIYIGGGTPSVLPSGSVSRILDTAKQLYEGDPVEVTMEMNPDDVTPEYISAIRQHGVNRISMGVQTFDDRRLRFVGRRHTAAEAINAVETIRKGGIGNISIDLMFGFPEETLADWQQDVQQAIALRPTHISAYSLMYEEGTCLHRMMSSGRVQPVDEDTSLAMYAYLMDALAAAGYEHYEISNFALPGHRSIHNSSYWQDIPYMGFGAAAHSYRPGVRSWNVADLKEYVEAIENGVLPSDSEQIDGNTHYDDLVTTALRTCEGLNLETLGATYRNYALRCADKHIKAGLLKHEGGRLHLTRRGLFVSDMVMSDLMMV